MRFCTVINCMDGRVQLPIINYMRKRFNTDYVDTITEPGPVKILAEKQPNELVDSILKCLDVSVQKHNSIGIGVVGHIDCAGNPAPRSEQIGQICHAINFLRQRYDHIEIIGLWIGENWKVCEISESDCRS